MGTGAYFGEIGLLEQIPRTATVESTRESRVLRISGDSAVRAPAGPASVPAQPEQTLLDRGDDEGPVPGEEPSDRESPTARG